MRGADRGARTCAERDRGTEWVFEYSPESFTGTELDFAVEICDAVNAVWEPTPQRKSILESAGHGGDGHAQCVCGPDRMVFAAYRDGATRSIISVHPHNDRGTAVAAAELAVMAGAERVEGTLFGNGERTGNVDIVTLALNLYSQGIDPKLDFSNINEVARCAEACNQLPIHPRHPYVGRSGIHGVFRLASGRHQERVWRRAPRATSGMCRTCPIDPSDLGPILRFHHSRQQPVRQRRGGVSVGARLPAGHAAAPANRIQPGGTSSCRYHW